jgi:hypothetical protein
MESETMKHSISRRRLLAGAASIGTGTLILPRVSTGTYRANEQVGIALVGMSGRSTWFVGLLERDSMMRGVALCDVDNRRAAEAYAKFPELPKYEDFRVMLDKQKDIDGVIVATQYVRFLARTFPLQHKRVRPEQIAAITDAELDVIMAFPRSKSLPGGLGTHTL